MSMSIVTRLNKYAASSAIGRYFKLEGCGHSKERLGTSLMGEIRAGTVTFLTMAYIISVNSFILSQTGGTCPDMCPKFNSTTECHSSQEYIDCVEIVRRDLITATALISGLSSLIMGIGSNLPFALAPGMGTNAYFAFTVVGFNGSNGVSYQTALAAVFIEGIAFMIISSIGLRKYLAFYIPNSIKVASAAGIGLFLTHIGLQYSAGIGLIAYDSATIVGLGGCPREYHDPLTNACTSHFMQSSTLYIGILGFFLIIILNILRVKGAMLYAIILIGVSSWFRHTSFTAFPDTPAGDAAYQYFSKVVDVHHFEKIVGALKFNLYSRDVWIALITLLFVDILDTTGGMVAMAKFGGLLNRETGDFEGSQAAFFLDGACISLGAIFGSAPVTVFSESGAGIQDGARTGLSAITVAFWFFISIFFAPIFSSLPSWSSGPALIATGAVMMSSVREINWSYLGDAVPAFLTIALMPLTYSIAYGLIGGLSSYLVINGTVSLIEWMSCGNIKVDKSNQEKIGPEAFNEFDEIETGRENGK